MMAIGKPPVRDVLAVGGLAHSVHVGLVHHAETVKNFGWM